MGSTHEVKVVKIENIRQHPNADSLELTDIWGYQCVVRKDAHKIGDLLAYVEPDSMVPIDREPFKFLDDGRGKPMLRVTMRKFRGEPSYGLLVAAPEGSKEGDNVMEALGVQHYQPLEGGHGGTGPTGFKGGIQAKGPDLPAPEYDLENFRRLGGTNYYVGNTMNANKIQPEILEKLLAQGVVEIFNESE